MRQGQAGCQRPSEVRVEGECCFAEICLRNLQVPGKNGLSFGPRISCRRGHEVRTYGQVMRSGCDRAGDALPGPRTRSPVAEIRNRSKECASEHCSRGKELREIERESGFRARKWGRSGHRDRIGPAPGGREGERSVVEERLDPVGPGGQPDLDSETPLFIRGCQ